jgi:segregation and condensation protein A
MPAFVYKIEKFEGPLELLLELIEAEKLPIAEVALAQVADQFLQYVETAEDLPAETIADFLTVAAKLMVIKAKLLIDWMTPEEDDGPTLEHQLRMYKDYRDASKWIYERLREEQFAYSRPKTVMLITPKFAPPLDLSKERMAEIFAKALERLKPVIDLPKRVIARAVTIAEKISLFKNFISSRQQFKFHETLESGSRTEMIVSFLAMLELVKQRVIDVAQDDHLADIHINRL